MARRNIDTAAILQAGITEAHRLIDALPQEWYSVGLGWYSSVCGQIDGWSAESGYSRQQVSAVLANYNRNQTWAASKTVTRRALFRHEVRGMADVVRAVEAILALPTSAGHDDVLPYLTNGSKTRNFYWSCLDLAGCPCDRHIFAVWKLPHREGNYPLVVEGVQSVARTLGVLDRQGEALIWLARGYARGRTMRQYMP